MVIAAAAIPGPVVLLACAAILACFALVATARHEIPHRGASSPPSRRPPVRTPSVRLTRQPYDWAREHTPT